MSKSEGKKLIKPIPLSIILDPNYQTPFSKLENLQVDMDMSSKLGLQDRQNYKSEKPITVWQKFQTTILKAMSNLMVISQPTKTGVSCRSMSSMSLVPWGTVKSCDFFPEEVESLSSKAVPEPSSFYHSLRKGLQFLRYYATHSLQQGKTEQSYPDHTSGDPSKQTQATFVPPLGISFIGGGLYFPIVSSSSFFTTLSAPPSPKHQSRTQVPIPNNLFALAMSGLLVASPQHKYNSFYKGCLLSPVRTKGSSESLMSNLERRKSEDSSTPTSPSPSHPTSSYCDQPNFEFYFHTSILEDEPISNTNSRPYSSLPSTPLKFAMEKGTTKAGCIRIGTHWRTMNSKSSSNSQDSARNFHTVSVCSTSSSRKGNTLHFSCSTSSSPRSMAINCAPRRYKTESESSTDSFIEYSASVESTDSFCIVFEPTPGCIPEDLDRDVEEDDDDDWEDDDEEEDDSDDDDDKIFNYSSSITDDLFVEGGVFQADSFDQVDFAKQGVHNKKKAKTVSFDEDNLVSVIEFEDDIESKSSRETFWEMLARDRARFQDRIYRTEDILEPILMPHHRSKVYQERFNKI